MRNGILILCNGVDVSEYREWNSLSKNEALNNNRNTCSFTFYDQKLNENDEIVIYDYIINIQPITAGQDYMYVNDTYQLESKYVVGNDIYVDIMGIHRKMKIKEIDLVTNKITFTTTFTSDIPVKSLHGYKFFGGIIDNIKEIKLTKLSLEVQYDYSCVGYEKTMDRKTVIDTYISQYTREIIGRMIYKFVANDSESNVFLFDSTLTGTGGCSTTSNYNTEKIQGNFCQKGISSGNGTRYKTITGINISSFTDLRYRIKVKENQGNTISKLSLRIGTDASNYFEYNNGHVGLEWEDCRLYESASLAYPDNIVGSPSLSNITWICFYYEGSGTNYILFDSMVATDGGILMGPTKRGTVKLNDVRFNGVDPSVCIETLTKQFQHFRYVDYDRTIHYYYEDGESYSTFSITDTDRRYTSLDVKVDTSQIINRQLVEGSEAPAQSLYTQTKKADGVQTSFTLDFKPAGQVDYPDGTSKQGLKVFVNNIEKTVGLDGLVEESTVDFVYSFQEKVVRNASYPSLSNTDVIKFTYYPYKTVSVRYADRPSIQMMKTLVGGDGIFDGRIIIDKTIESTQLARQRAIIEVQTKKDPIVTYDFTTDIAGIGLGQMILVIDTVRGINKYFQVQKIQAQSKAGNLFTYKVSITQKFFDYVEFFQLLLKKTSNFQVNQNADIIIPTNDDEVIGIQENYIVSAISDGYYAGMIYNKFFNFLGLTGTTSVAGFIGDKNQHWMLGGTGTATIQTITGYNKTKALELTTTSSAKVETISIPINNNLPIQVSLDVKVLSQSGSGTINVYFDEYDSGGLLINSNIVIIDETLPDFVNYLIELTTKNNTEYYRVGVSVNSHTADVLLGAVVIKDQSVNTVLNDGVADFSFAS